MRNKVLVLLAIVVFALSGVASAKTYHFGYVVQDLGNQFWVTVAKGVQDRAAELGHRVTVLDARTDPNRQLANVEDLIQRGIDALLISPWDSPSGGTATEVANKAGVPVFVVDIGVSSGKIETLIVSDNYKGGVLAAEYMAQLLGGSGDVAIIQCQLGYELPALREKGFEDRAKELGLRVVAKQPADSQRSLGMTVMQNILQARPNLKGVFACNDEMALGAVEAIRAAGKQNQIAVIGFDAIADALEAVEDGRLAATVAQQPYEMGRMGVDAAIAYLEGKKLEPTTYVEVKLVTPENLADFR